MVCKDKWAQWVQDMEGITGVAAASVDGALRCIRPECGQLVRKDTRYCLAGHSQRTRQIEIQVNYADGQWDNFLMDIPADTPEEQIEGVALEYAQRDWAGADNVSSLAVSWVPEYEEAEAEWEEELAGATLRAEVIDALFCVLQEATSAGQAQVDPFDPRVVYARYAQVLAQRGSADQSMVQVAYGPAGQPAEETLEIPLEQYVQERVPARIRGAEGEEIGTAIRALLEVFDEQCGGQTDWENDPRVQAARSLVPPADSAAGGVFESDDRLVRGDVAVEWEYIGEGWGGDYDEADPQDEPLLRFYVQRRTPDGEWADVEDASYCTQMPATATPAQRRRGLEILMERFYDDVVAGKSVKKLGEEMSWIGLDDVALPTANPITVRLYDGDLGVPPIAQLAAELGPDAPPTLFQEQEGDQGVLLSHVGEATVAAHVESHGISLDVVGYGVNTVADGYGGGVVYIDLERGEPVLYVWSDIGKGDPTHRIPLAGAAEELRELEAGELDETATAPTPWNRMRPGGTRRAQAVTDGEGLPAIVGEVGEHRVAATVGPRGVALDVRDYGVRAGRPGWGGGIAYLDLEQVSTEGPVLYVWSDIGLEGPTHRIPLAGARESLRQEEG